MTTGRSCFWKYIFWCNYTKVFDDKGAFLLYLWQYQAENNYSFFTSGQKLLLYTVSHFRLWIMKHGAHGMAIYLPRKGFFDEQ